MNTTHTEGVHIVTDDTEILACLAYHGRAPAMLHADTEAAALGCGGGVRSVCLWTTERAFYCVKHFTGYSNPEDCGYCMLVLALDVFSKQQAAEIAEAFVNNGRDFSGPLYEEYMEMPSVEVN